MIIIIQEEEDKHERETIFGVEQICLAHQPSDTPLDWPRAAQLFAGQLSSPHSSKTLTKQLFPTNSLALAQALNGFLLILTCDGEVFYTSQTVETYLGFHQVSSVAVHF